MEPSSLALSAATAFATAWCTQHGYTNDGVRTTLSLRTGPCTVRQFERKIIDPCIAHTKEIQRKFNGIAALEAPDERGYRNVTLYHLPV